MRPITRETVVERRQPSMRWSAVFAGAFVSAGLWMMFQLLGAGIGLSAIDASNSGSLRSVGIGTGIWSIIAPLLALFLGGMVAGRLATTAARGIGALHGLVVWAMTSLVGLFAVISLVTAIASGAVKLGGAVVHTAGSAASAVQPQQAMSALGIDTNDLLAPINNKLQQEGKPPITSDQVVATVRGVAQRGLHEGRIDRNVLVEELARNTQLSQADAQDIASQFGAQYQQAVDKLQRAGSSAEKTGLQIAQQTGKGLFWGGIGLLVGLCAAVGGGALGVRTRRHFEGGGGGGERIVTREEERVERPVTVAREDVETPAPQLRTGVTRDR